jgi:hypothetical protein
MSRPVAQAQGLYHRGRRTVNLGLGAQDALLRTGIVRRRSTVRTVRTPTVVGRERIRVRGGPTEPPRRRCRARVS